MKEWLVGLSVVLLFTVSGGMSMLIFIGSLQGRIEALESKPIPAPCRCQRETFRPDLMLKVENR